MKNSFSAFLIYLLIIGFLGVFAFILNGYISPLIGSLNPCLIEHPTDFDCFGNNFLNSLIGVGLSLVITLTLGFIFFKKAKSSIKK